MPRISLHNLFFSCILLLVALCFSLFSSASAEEFENEDFSLSQAGGYFQEATSFVISPKNNTTVHWSFFQNNPSNFSSTSEITRISVPRSRNFYVFSNDSKMEKFSFHIERSIENRFFRIESIDANPSENFLPTITVKNASPFSFSMNGWEISGKNFSVSLPDEPLEAGEERTFIADLQNSNTEFSEEILLISPSKRVRDRVRVPSLQSSEIYSRFQCSTEKENKIHTRNPRPHFCIQKK